MNSAEILRHARPAWAGRRMEFHDRLSSTNDRALEILAEEGARAHLAAVFAEEQSEGRGRQGRAWHAAPGLSLACTVLVTSGVRAETSGLLPLAAALSLAASFRETCALETELRWPNDVDARGAKVAGILVEARWRGSEPEGFAVGIGANLYQRPEDFPPELRGLATSAKTESGRDFSRAAFAAALLDALEDRLLRLGSDPGELLREAAPLWAHDPGTELEVATAGGAIRGTFGGIGPAGELLLDSEGGRRALVHGEVVRVRVP